MSKSPSDPKIASRAAPARKPAMPVSTALSFFAVAAAAAFVSCGLVDLRPIGYATRPADRYDVVGEGEAVWIEFDEDVDRDEAERRLGVEGASGGVSGDRRWEGNRLLFEPTPPWTPGVRYEFVFAGELRAANGRSDVFDVRIPFTAVRPVGAPRLVSSVPADGVSVPTDVVLTFVFSEAMDRASVERAWSLSPSADCDFSWSADGTTLTARPRARLIPLRRYSWRVGTGAAAVDGAALGTTAEGSFVTDADAIPPRVTRTGPALKTGGVWDFTAPDAALADLDVGQAAMIRFSEDVDPETARSAVRFEPTRRGVVELPDARTIVYRFEETPEPGVATELVVSASVRDLAGLAMIEEYRERFVPATEWLRVTSVGQEGGTPVADPAAGAVASFEAGDPNGDATLVVRFSRPLALAERIAAVSKIRCDAFFPASTLPPVLTQAAWRTATDELALTFTGFSESDAAVARFYRLTVPGGKGGVGDGNGRTLEADIVVTFEEAFP